jgi:hypothetical protein
MLKLKLYTVLGERFCRGVVVNAVAVAVPPRVPGVRATFASL